MKKLVQGLHHVTAITADAQKNVNFYAGILGLRLVKKTINYDAPEVYHLYYGNEVGSPGTILTFFAYPQLPAGRKGKGQLTVTSFSVAESALDYWMKRLNKFGVKYEKPQQRFEDELVITLEDHEGLGLELIFNNKDERQGYAQENIPLQYAIKGFYGITLLEEGYEETACLLTQQMDHVCVSQSGNRYRFASSNTPGSIVDVLCCPDALRGQGGSGTVHHVAFATESDSTQLEARKRLISADVNVTPVLDRQYFHSIYFREPGGVLFEIATIPPGFTIDEDLAHLGEALKLPSWEEKHRSAIERRLEPIHLPNHQFTK